MPDGNPSVASPLGTPWRTSASVGSRSQTIQGSLHLIRQQVGLFTTNTLQVCPHNRCPKTGDVLYDLSRHVVTHRYVASDLIGHLYQVLLGVIQRHADAASTDAGRISTAVTLYSGQLVAQSELSVVITLVPLMG